MSRTVVPGRRRSTTSEDVERDARTRSNDPGDANRGAVGARALTAACSLMKKTARRLAGTLTAAGSRYAGCDASDSAAGIAYRVLFSLAPLAVVLVSVFGLLL
jgi:hypothetical protein